ncbi:MAG: hypothetical protein GXO54_02380 [Chloroflexi bacterium]|nr:hypothetical protein [Chloroflexota bacterium]
MDTFLRGLHQLLLWSPWLLGFGVLYLAARGLSPEGTTRGSGDVIAGLVTLGVAGWLVRDWPTYPRLGLTWALVIIGLVRWARAWRHRLTLAAGLLVLGSAGGLLWAFAPLAGLVLPPYPDAALHAWHLRADYLHVPPDVSPHGAILRIGPWKVAYYHQGSYALMAWPLWAGLSFQPMGLLALTILALGVILPWGLYRLQRSQGAPAGLAALIAWLGTWAWTTPFYGLTWGKYPALWAIALTPGVLAHWGPSSRARRFVARLLPGLLLMGLGWVHSRVALWAGLTVLVWWWLRWMGPWTARRGFWFAWGVYGLWAAHGLLIRDVGFWRFIARPAWLGMGLLVGLNLLRPRRAGLASAGWAALLALAYAPLPWLPGIGSPWIDRPTFELLAPLTTAFTWAAALRRAWPQGLTLETWRAAGQVVLGALALGGALTWLAHKPPWLNPVTIIAQEDDVVAQTFLRRQAQPPAHVLIARGGGTWAYDGGAWVPVLTGLQVERVSRKVRWWEANFLRRQCAPGRTVWAYVDENPPGLQPPPSRPWLDLPIAWANVRIYRVRCAALPAP